MKNDYEIRGDKVAIYLRRRDGINLETIIDLEDLEKVKSFTGKWYATTRKNIDGFYVNGIFGDYKTIYLHRYILDAPKGSHVDHINHETLDNTRKNLRITTPDQNHQNRSTHRNSSSGVRGVNWHRQIGKWKCVVRAKGGKRFERFFDNKEDAIEAAMKARRVYMPFSIENIDLPIDYSEEDLLKEYTPYQHHKKVSGRKSKSGYLGVYWHKKQKKWLSYLVNNGKKKFLGSFKDKQEAIDAVKKAKK